MFFSNDFVSPEPITVLHIKRNSVDHKAMPRSFHAISYRILGNATFSDSHSQVSVQTGDIVFVPANLGYCVKNSEENLIAIHFNCSAKLFDKITKFTPKSPIYFEKKFLKLYESWKRKQFGYEYECMSIIHSILNMIEKEMAESSYFDKNSQLSLAIEYINENYTSSAFTVSELAKVCGMSETFFRKIFKNNFSVSPLKYINNLRLKRALELLSSDYYKISEIAEKSGFSNVYYFSSFIKKETGYSPVELRNCPEKINIPV